VRTLKTKNIAFHFFSIVIINLPDPQPQLLSSFVFIKFKDLAEEPWQLSLDFHQFQRVFKSYAIICPGQIRFSN